MGSLIGTSCRRSESYGVETSSSIILYSMHEPRTTESWLFGMVMGQRKNRACKRDTNLRVPTRKHVVDVAQRETQIKSNHILSKSVGIVPFKLDSTDAIWRNVLLDTVANVEPATKEITTQDVVTTTTPNVRSKLRHQQRRRRRIRHRCRLTNAIPNDIQTVGIVRKTTARTFLYNSLQEIKPPPRLDYDLFWFTQNRETFV